MKHDNQVFIVTGEKAGGKTAFIKKLIHNLREKEIKLVGFYSEGHWDNNIRSGFDLVDINSGNRIGLCKNKAIKGWIAISHFWFNPEAIEVGTSILENYSAATPELIVVDEVGKLEAEQEVWYKSVSATLHNTQLPLLLSIRKQFIDLITEKFCINNVITFDIENNTPGKVSNRIINLIR